MASADFTMKIRFEPDGLLPALQATVFAVRNAMEIIPEWHAEEREAIERQLLRVDAAMEQAIAHYRDERKVKSSNVDARP